MVHDEKQNTIIHSKIDIYFDEIISCNSLPISIIQLAQFKSLSFDTFLHAIIFRKRKMMIIKAQQYNCWYIPKRIYKHLTLNRKRWYRKKVDFLVDIFHSFFMNNIYFDFILFHFSFSVFFCSMSV